MKVLVTGAAGFLGSHLVKKLTAIGIGTSVLVRPHSADFLRSILPNSDLFSGDARDPEIVAKALCGCDAVFHCAALVGADIYARYPVETMTMEIDSLRTISLAALKRPGCKVLFPSTSAVYGGRAVAAIVDESSDVYPVSSYAISKRYNELFLAAQYRENGLQSTSLRIFNIYGPGQDDRLVIPRFIEHALAGTPITIFGDGQQQRDFVYVDDVVNAFIGAYQSIQGCSVLNVSSGVAVSVKTLAERIVTGTGNKSALEFVPLPSERISHEVSGCIGSSTELHRLLDLAPLVPLEQGLASTIAEIQVALVTP